MIISRTPFRVSFFGGGTDYPAWYRRNGGAVLATAIDKYCYLTVRHLPPFFEHKIRVVYSVIESCRTVDEIKHPSVRACLKYMKIDRGIEIHHDGDLPARSGMGSSSSFTVGLLNALHALQGKMPSKEQLAASGIEVEQEWLKEAVGSQDQISAAYGGFNRITFSGSRFHVQPMTISDDRIEELQSHLMLFYTGIQRTAASIAQGVVEKIPSPQSERILRTFRSMVDEAQDILAGGDDLHRFGRLLDEAWRAKCGLSANVSNPAVMKIYEAALSAGAVGGKLTGAGGGGFMLLFVPPSRQARVRDTLHNLIHVPFKFDNTGSQILHFDRERDYEYEEQERDSRVIAAFRELAASNME